MGVTDNEPTSGHPPTEMPACPSEPGVTPQRSVGLLGIGLLGEAMASRLIESGVLVTGFDKRATRRQRLIDLGGQVGKDAADVVSQAELVLVSLPTSDVAMQVLDEVTSVLRAGQTIIDTTTGQPDEMMAIGERLAHKKVGYVEATVAGSSTQMRSGQARIFLGGARAIVDQLGWLWEILVDRTFYLGQVGAASRFKLVHNLALGLHRAVLAESLVFAETLGFDAASVLEILPHTPAASAVMATKGPKMVANDWTTQARLAQHLKDVRLIVEEARKRGYAPPLSLVHQRLLEQAVELGLGDADNSAIIEALRHETTRPEGAHSSDTRDKPST